MRTPRKAGLKTMDSSEVEQFENILKKRRDETVRFLNRLGDETKDIDSDTPADAADRCVISLSKEALFHQSDERRGMLRTIDAALGRIQQGTFGVCIACGEQINARRLNALPWTQYCIHCQERRERGEELDNSFDWADRPIALRKAG